MQLRMLCMIATLMRVPVACPAEDTQDMVIVEEAEAGSQQSSQQQQGSKSPQAAGKEGGLDRLWHASAAQPALVQEDA